HADLRAERGLRDVDRHGRDEIEPLALEEAIRLDLESQQEIAGRTVARTAAALTLETDLGARVDAGRHGDVHLLPNAHLARAAARGTALARNGAFPQTHWTRALH